MFFNWFRRNVRDAILGGVSDAVTVLDTEAQKRLGEDDQATREQLLSEIFPRLLVQQPKKVNNKK